jgi:hypothetical protein
MYSFNKRLRLTKFYGLPVNAWVLMIFIFLMLAITGLIAMSSASAWFCIITILAAIYCFVLLVKVIKNMDDHLLIISKRAAKKDIKRVDFYL